MEKMKRMEILINLLNRRPYLTKQAILDYFSQNHAIEISTRTLERDFCDLGIDYHIQVNYNRAERGYHLEEDDKEQINSFLTFAGRVYLAELFKEGLKTFDELKQIFYPEDFSKFKGLQWIEPIFLTIRQRRILKFVHHNYVKETLKDYRIVPFQLREFKGRWYVTGVAVNKNGIPIEKHIKSFGLARIAHLEIKGVASVSPKPYLNQLKKFEQIIGLNYDEAEGQKKIILAVTPTQYKYLESLPLHKTQQKVGLQKDGRITVHLRLIPNYELKMQLLKLGDQIEVLEPDYLRKEIKETLQKSLKQYK